MSLPSWEAALAVLRRYRLVVVREPDTRVSRITCNCQTLHRKERYLSGWPALNGFSSSRGSRKPRGDFSFFHPSNRARARTSWDTSSRRFRMTGAAFRDGPPRQPLANLDGSLKFCDAVRSGRVLDGCSMYLCELCRCGRFSQSAVCSPGPALVRASGASPLRPQGWCCGQTAVSWQRTRPL